MPKQIQEFIVSALRIDKRCKQDLRKVLKEEYYFFNKRCVFDENGNVVLNPNHCPEHNIYGSKVQINTIVGKNGSGKSSLLEMMYRIINNFSSLLVRDTKRGAAYPLYFIDGLWADLYYVIDNGETGPQLARLSCQGNDVLLYVEESIIFQLHLTGDDKKYTQAEIAQHWDNLFYTIVTNYSVQSFISTDFENEDSYKVGEKGTAQQKDGILWMSSLFHKNDGYLTPIVLNPYRDEKGNMNMEVEKKLTISRLTSILLFYKEHRTDFLEGYRLRDIRYELNSNIVVEKYVGITRDDDVMADSIRHRVWNFPQAANNPQTYAYAILHRFGFRRLDFSDEIIERAAAYLVYKVLTVAKSYPTYHIFQITEGAVLFDQEVAPKHKLNIGALVDEIIKDKSHITLKIRQTRRLLQQYKPSKAVDLQQEFSFYEYQEALGDSINPGGLTTLLEQIPPSFFVPTIFFDKIEKGRIVEAKVPLTRMSSGERQYLYNFSTIIYHLRNLLSIQDTSRIRYRSIHLVFDEVEICFHPEYQRKFINGLLTIINKTRVNNHCAIQITIATHSPFILSDVPQDSILYLEDGQNAGNKITVNPFGANINDVLQQSFFLENGFVGEFAQRKINSLVDYLKDGKNKKEWNNNNAEYFIDNVVGDTIISSLLRELMVEKIDNDAQNPDYTKN